MSRERRYLVVRADRSTRIVTRLPRLAADEIAVPLVLNFPDTWGRVTEPVTIEMPGFDPHLTADVEATVYPDPEDQP